MRMLILEVVWGRPNFLPPTILGRSLTKDRSLVAHVCGDTLSRYTCRSRFPLNPGVFQVQQQYRITLPLKGPVAPVALELPGVSHVKLPLKRCRATGGCSSCSRGCRATLCNQGYRCILNYYPINSKTILWGNSEIAPQRN